MGELLEKGTYIALKGESGALIAMDEYIIENISNGFKIQSDNIIFGPYGFRQRAEMLVDDQWLMQYIRIVVDDKNLELNVNIENENFRIIQNHGQEEISKLVSLQFNQYFFIYKALWYFH